MTQPVATMFSGGPVAFVGPLFWDAPLTSRSFAFFDGRGWSIGREGIEVLPEGYTAYWYDLTASDEWTATYTYNPG